MDSIDLDKMVFTLPKTFELRKALAQVLVDRVQYRMPLAVDTIVIRADQVFAAVLEHGYRFVTMQTLAERLESGALTR